MESGAAVWTADVAWWLTRKAREHGWEQLGSWAGCDDKTLRRAATRETLTLDVGIIDRLLIREGSTSLPELCAA